MDQGKFLFVINIFEKKMKFLNRLYQKKNINCQHDNHDNMDWFLLVNYLHELNIAKLIG